MNPQVSIMVLSYCSSDTIKDTLKSIFLQNYDNIELLIGDDGSEDFDEQYMKSWIDSQKANNINAYSIIHSSKNQGTVKNLMQMQQKAKGEYLFHIAADDVIYDEDVISEFVKFAEELNDSKKVIYAQTEMWNETLSEKIEDFISTEDIRLIKSLSPYKMYEQCYARPLLPACFFYSKSILPIIGDLCNYSMIEDIPIQLRLLRQNISIYYLDSKPCIKHRHGGISHNESNEISKTKLLYNRDFVTIYQNEIAPYLNSITYEGQKRNRRKYELHKAIYYSTVLPGYLDIHGTKDEIVPHSDILKMQWYKIERKVVSISIFNSLNFALLLYIFGKVFFANNYAKWIFYAAGTVMILMVVGIVAYRFLRKFTIN